MPVGIVINSVTRGLSRVASVWTGTATITKVTLVGGVAFTAIGVHRLRQQSQTPPPPRRPLKLPERVVEDRIPSKIETDAKALGEIITRGLGEHSLRDLLTREDAIDGYLDQIHRLTIALLNVVAVEAGRKPELVTQRLDSVRKHSRPLLDELREGLLDGDRLALLKTPPLNVPERHLRGALGKIDSAAVLLKLIPEGDGSQPYLLSEDGAGDLSAAATKIAGVAHKLSTNLEELKGSSTFARTVIKPVLGFGRRILKSSSKRTAIKVYVWGARAVIEKLYVGPMVKEGVDDVLDWYEYRYLLLQLHQKGGVQVNFGDLSASLRAIKGPQAARLATALAKDENVAKDWKKAWDQWQTRPNTVKMDAFFLEALARHRESVKKGVMEVYELLRGVVDLFFHTAWDHSNTKLFDLIWNDLNVLSQAAAKNDSETYRTTMTNVLQHLHAQGKDQNAARVVLAVRNVINRLVAGDVPGYKDQSKEEFQRSFPTWLLDELIRQLKAVE